MTGADAGEPQTLFLKLRCSRLPWVNGTKAQGIITTRRVSEGFTGTLDKTLQLDPSLTFRVGMSTNAQLQDAGSGAIEKPALSRSEVLLFRYAPNKF